MSTTYRPLMWTRPAVGVGYYYYYLMVQVFHRLVDFYQLVEA